MEETQTIPAPWGGLLDFKPHSPKDFVVYYRYAPSAEESYFGLIRRELAEIWVRDSRMKGGSGGRSKSS